MYVMVSWLSWVKLDGCLQKWCPLTNAQVVTTLGSTMRYGPWLVPGFCQALLKSGVIIPYVSMCHMCHGQNMATFPSPLTTENYGVVFHLHPLATISNGGAVPYWGHWVMAIGWFFWAHYPRGFWGPDGRSYVPWPMAHGCSADQDFGLQISCRSSLWALTPVKEVGLWWVMWLMAFPHNFRRFWIYLTHPIRPFIYVLSIWANRIFVLSGCIPPERMLG